MKMNLKSKLAALSFAIIATLALSNCETKNSSSTSGTHSMGGPKPSYPMSNDQMAGMH